MQSELGRAEEKRAEVQRKADALRDVIELRSVWLKRVDAVRKSLFEGMWLTEMVPVRDESGAVTGVRIVGRGWADRFKAIEAKALESGRKATAVEELRDRLKSQSVFGKEAQDVKIVGVKDIEAYLIEFTIETVSATASVPKDATER